MGRTAFFPSIDTFGFPVKYKSPNKLSGHFVVALQNLGIKVRGEVIFSFAEFSGSNHGMVVKFSEQMYITVLSVNRKQFLVLLDATKLLSPMIHGVGPYSNTMMMGTFIGETEPAFHKAWKLNTQGEWDAVLASEIKV